MGRLRVLVVDDSAFFRRRLSEILASDPEIEVAGTASHGQLALAKIPMLNPDLVTLDVEMPVMDGLETLAAIRRVYPGLPVVMVSVATERGAGVTVDALLRGASDYVAKPTAGEGLSRLREDLLAKVRRLAARARAVEASAQAPLPPARDTAAGERPIELLAVGVSTGGPNALHDLLRPLPADLPVPVVVVQHMPPMFTRSLAERLDQTCGIAVCEASAGQRLGAGRVFIAPGDFHMKVTLEGGVPALALDQAPPENSCRPSVDVLFRSVAALYGPGALALVLTGMGQDGLRGAEQLREAGGSVWVQDEASSVIWGMPGAVARAGLAQRVLPIDQLGPEVVRRIRESRAAVARGGAGA